MPRADEGVGAQREGDDADVGWGAENERNSCARAQDGGERGLQLVHERGGQRALPKGGRCFAAALQRLGCGESVRARMQRLERPLDGALAPLFGVRVHDVGEGRAPALAAAQAPPAVGERRKGGAIDDARGQRDAWCAPDAPYRAADVGECREGDRIAHGAVTPRTGLHDGSERREVRREQVRAGGERVAAVGEADGEGAGVEGHGGVGAVRDEGDVLAERLVRLDGSTGIVVV